VLVGVCTTVLLTMIVKVSSNAGRGPLAGSPTASSAAMVLSD
jgi:hypothetical protein